MKSSLYSVFYVGILFTAGLNATVTQGPSNTVAEIGKQVKLTCTANAPVGYWILSKDGTATDQLIIVGPGCGAVNAPFGNHYTIEPIGGGTTCNLNIFDITMEQGGVYKCLEATSVNASIFTVIDPNPSITVTNGSGVVAGDQVIMSYTVRYNSSTASSQTPTIQPVLTWKDSNGNNIPGSATPGVNSVTSILSLRAERQAMQPYTCRISYEIKKTSTANGISFADNIPNSVSTPPSTPTIDVAYAPIISSITTSQPVCPGKTVEITCHATANPAPTYSWIGPDARNYSGETIEAVMNGTYSCTASNVIKGSTRSDTKQATLSVSDNCSQDNLKVIIIVCVVSYILGIIATIVLFVYYNRNIGFKLKLTDRFPCMNDDVACGCIWICLSFCVFTLVGLVFIIFMIIKAKCGRCCCCCCSQERGHSKETVKDFHNPRDIIEPIDYPLPDYDDPYEGINIEIHSATQENTRKPKENQSPPNVDNRTAVPSSPPPDPPNDAPQNQQTNTAQGPVYSELHRNTDRSVQPQQYIAATVKQFHNPRHITDGNEIPEMEIHSSTLGPNGDDTYAKINDERHRVSQDNSKKDKDQKKQHNGNENGKSTSADKKENQPPNLSISAAVPSSPPPNPPNDAPQHQQSTSAQGPVYSELPVTDRNVQPQQYIEGNSDASNYGELKKT